MSSLVSWLGQQNPQMLRELRGRLKPRSILAAVGLSVIFQVLVSLFFLERDWVVETEQYRLIFRSLSWAIANVLFVLGGYYIVNDLTQEEKTGTLNFIRLSPRPAREILLGKLLGVPVLPVTMAVTALPLHLISGLLAGLSPVLLISYYLVVLCGAAFILTLALLIGLTGSNQSVLVGQQAPTAIAFAALALFFLSPTFLYWNRLVTWQQLPDADAIAVGGILENFQWLYLPLSDSIVFAHLFTLGHLAVSTLLLWQILLRQFRTPEATLASKRLSYVGIVYVNVLVWGFFQSSTLDQEDAFAGILALYALNIVAFLSLIFGLAQPRQALLDWVRYRRGGWLDWVWGDLSPSAGAIALSYLMVAVLILPWLLLQGTPPAGTILAVVSFGSCLLSYATLVQLIFSTRLRSPLIWAVGILAVLIIVPFTVLSIFSVSPTASPWVMTLWMLLGLPIWDYTEPGILRSAALGLVLQWALLGLLLAALGRSLRRLAAR